MSKSLVHHVMIKVDSWPRAKKYYQTTLGELGYKLAVDRDTLGGFTSEGETPSLYILQENNPTRIHLAIRAHSAPAVTAYHKAAIAAGGTDNGAPGPRSHYINNGIGAFVIDPWDNNIEVVYEPSS